MTSKSRVRKSCVVRARSARTRVCARVSARGTKRAKGAGVFDPWLPRREMTIDIRVHPDPRLDRDACAWLFSPNGSSLTLVCSALAAVDVEWILMWACAGCDE